MWFYNVFIKQMHIVSSDIAKKIEKDNNRKKIMYYVDAISFKIKK